jgi:hypothetical protein
LNHHACDGFVVGWVDLAATGFLVNSLPHCMRGMLATSSVRVILFPIPAGNYCVETLFFPEIGFQRRVQGS